jgi:hypothetical protein
LLGQLHAARRLARRLRQDRRVRRAAAAPGASATAVEDRQLDPAFARDLGERLLSAEDLPLRCEVAAVLARVGVADHHLGTPIGGEARVVEERGQDGGRGAKVLDRLEERHGPQRRLGQFERTQDVRGRGGRRDDQRVGRVAARGREHLPRPR